MSVTIKASLYNKTWHGDPVERRRFSADEVTARSYVFLVKQVEKVFPSLTAAEDLILAWIDTDGDMITISSDEDLMQALEYFNGNIFLLCVKMGSGSASTFSKPPDDHQDIPTNGLQSRNSANLEQGGYFHPGVICDGCNGRIYATRFKCMTCFDYDLCSGCEEKGIHVNHNMIAIGLPANPNPWISFFGGPHRGRGSFYGGDRGRRRGGGRGWHSNPFYYGGLGYRSGAEGWDGGLVRAEGWEEGSGGRGRPGDPGSPYFPEQCRKPKDGQSKASGGQEPIVTERKGGTSEEDRRGYLREMGKAVSNFLEPFGVKVDVGVVGDEGGTSIGTTADLKTCGETSNAATAISEEVVETTLVQLKTMGYEDEGGWLRELIRAKGGDVTKVLDALHPVTEEI